jgi:hypothetical protein
MQDIYKELLAPPPPVYTDVHERAVRTQKHTERTAANADLVMLGDQWLEPAIRNGLLRPYYKASQYRCRSTAGSVLPDRCNRAGSRHAMQVQVLEQFATVLAGASQAQQFWKSGQPRGDVCCSCQVGMHSGCVQASRVQDFRAQANTRLDRPAAASAHWQGTHQKL